MKTFTYNRNIHVYETDLMGIVHHSNYLRFCEEARVAWFRQNGLSVLSKEDIFGLVVVETRVQHKRPLRYGDQLEIEIQLQVKGAKLLIQYHLKSAAHTFAVAETVHCRIDENFKVKRLDQKMMRLTEKEKWTETWL